VEPPLNGMPILKQAKEYVVGDKTEFAVILEENHELIFIK